MEQIFKLAEIMHLNDMKFRIDYDPSISSEVRMTADQYYEVANTASATLALYRFDKVIFETKNVDTMFELLSYTIKNQI